MKQTNGYIVTWGPRAGQTVHSGTEDFLTYPSGDVVPPEDAEAFERAHPEHADTD